MDIGGISITQLLFSYHTENILNVLENSFKYHYQCSRTMRLPMSNGKPSSVASIAILANSLQPTRRRYYIMLLCVYKYTERERERGSTSGMKAPLRMIPWRSRLRWYIGMLVQVRPLPELQLPKAYICNARVGCAWYTPVIENSTSSSRQRCATRNSQSSGMWISAKKSFTAVSEFRKMRHLLFDSLFVVEICVSIEIHVISGYHSN
jgi:hypothetical protein